MSEKTKRGNIHNLVPNEARTPEERRLNAIKAGKASGEVRKKRKTFKEVYMALSEAPFKPMGEMASDIAASYPNVSVDEAIMIANIVKATNGDTKASQFIRDTIGEMPTVRQEVTATISENDKKLLDKVGKELGIGSSLADNCTPGTETT